MARIASKHSSTLPASAPSRTVYGSRLSTASQKSRQYSVDPHGMPTTQAETINADLLEFIRS